VLCMVLYSIGAGQSKYILEYITSILLRPILMTLPCLISTLTNLIDIELIVPLWKDLDYDRVN